MMVMFPKWCYSLLIMAAYLNAVHGLIDIYLSGLLPFEGGWYGGRTVKVASEIALDQVNARDDILPDYRLNVLWNDTKCDRGTAMKLLFHHIYTKPTKIMVFGGGCSTVSEVTAATTHHFNIVQLSPISASPALSDRSRYPRFLRTAVSALAANLVRIEMFDKFHWTHVATIHQAEEYFSLVNKL